MADPVNQMARRSELKGTGSSNRDQGLRPRRSLPARLLILTMSTVAVAGLLVLVPDFGRDRRVMLGEKVQQALIAALSAGAPGDSRMLAQRDELLRASGIEAVRIVDARGTTTVLAGDPAMRPAETFDLRHETEPQSLLRGLEAAIAGKDRLIQIVADSPSVPGAEIEFVMHQVTLSRALRTLDGPDVLLMLLIASAVGLLIYLALLILLVRPMRRLTSSITAFRDDPEHGVPLDAQSMTLLHDDEISVAGRELAAMQRELRAALWRNSRLAALGTVVAKVSHDVRGILTPALLQADRLRRHSDPTVQRAGETMMQAFERIIDLVQRTLDFACEGPPPPSLTQIRLHRLLAEAADSTRAAVAPFEFDNQVPVEQEVKADRNHLYRVLVNLLRNAAEAGASRVCARVRRRDGALAIELADNGPGLPEAVRANLFRPFTSTSRHGGAGLGLAIARDLMLAHGGGIELVSTGRSGTVFRLTLPISERAGRVPQAAEPA
jgi:signal transduction histidine kinase